MTAYAHPILDRRFPAGTPIRTFTDAELDTLVGDFVRAAMVARAAGFDFVDVKHCHGYLGHELLSAWDRPGPYGGAAGRTTFLRRIVEGIRRDAPGLAIGVRRVGLRRGAVPQGCARRRHAGSGHAVLPARLRAACRSGGRARSRAGPRLPARAREPGHPLGVGERRQPVLQPAHPAPGAVPAVRRLPAARGSAGRLRPADRRRRRAQARVPEPAAGRHQLFLPAGMAAATSARPRSGTASPTSSASAGWCCRIRRCRPTSSPAGR